MTDVVGSTALWEAHRAEMPDALVPHDSIVHGTVATAAGDGMLAAFADADAATEAVQPAVAEPAATEWGPTGPLRIRASLR
jgi:class 3 adenylate cyclase